MNCSFCSFCLWWNFMWKFVLTRIKYVMENSGALVDSMRIDQNSIKFLVEIFGDFYRLYWNTLQSFCAFLVKIALFLTNVFHMQELFSVVTCCLLSSLISRRRSYIYVRRRSCVRRDANCDHRPNDCCYSSSCRCNLWGSNCRCQRIGLFQKWG